MGYLIISAKAMCAVPGKQSSGGHISNSGSAEHRDVYPPNKASGTFTGITGREPHSTPANNTADAADAASDADAADTANANLLQELTNIHSATNQEQHRSREAQLDVPMESNVPLPPPAHPTDATQTDTDRSDIAPLVVICFPHGRPCAPVPGAQQERFVHQTNQDVFGASGWAPFRSQSNWEIAHWAKTHGPLPQQWKSFWPYQTYVPNALLYSHLWIATG
ncbi:hypothetical protein EI94DRAFT_1797809 [Lactarius quietus]|nr:hypothetical protein EI94DRAFT_1797809 [Lactarius quietus]